ncbi:MAG: ATP-binding protein [Chloroflexi bacterium]|nr:ATP-binding protein [Chloroflexota bacterium]
MTTSYKEVLLEPRSIEETGLSMHFLVNLTLKTIYNAGEFSGQEVAASLRMPFVNVVEPILEFLKREELVRITGSGGGFGERAFRYILSAKGAARTQEALDRNQYVGPVPVTLEQYSTVVRQETVASVVVRPADVEAALQAYTFSRRTYDKIGPAVNSGRSLFLYGPPGNGKTSIATSIVRMLRGQVHIPYAVTVDGQVIRIFDAVTHRPVALEKPKGKTTGEMGVRRPDERWITIERPAVVVGGELTLENLDLIYDPVSKTYEAPFQMKANGGMFLIDDFGRQQVPPRSLLNRWIVPLDTRVDYLTLHTGMKLEVPFEELVVFSTNLNPTELVDHAFLRRIRHKIHVMDPTEREFHEIFRRACQSKNIPYDQRSFAYLLQKHFRDAGRELKAVYPRDILDQIIDIATYRGIRPVLDKELLDQACEAYFVDI